MNDFPRWFALCFAFVCVFTYADNGGNWKLVASESKVAYGSIKNNTIGESNHFARLSGNISKKGQVKVNIDLASVETLIPTRNERMLEHIFGSSVKAVLSANVDLDFLESLPLGGTTLMPINGSLQFAGQQLAVNTSFFVARLAEDKLLVTSDEIIMMKTADLGIDSGIDVLQALAKLKGITRVFPVTIRLLFVKKEVGLANATQVEKELHDKVALTGQQIFNRQCAACHNLNEPKNGLGPHLLGIVGRKAASVDSFTYSTALKSSNVSWTKKDLTNFLKSPSIFIPGNTMPFSGISNPEDLKSLVEYLSTSVGK